MNFHQSGVSERAIIEAAKALHERQKVDAGWGPWSDLTPDDRWSFYQDVLAVVKAIKEEEGS